MPIGVTSHNTLRSIFAIMLIATPGFAGMVSYSDPSVWSVNAEDAALAAGVLPASYGVTTETFAGGSIQTSWLTFRTCDYTNCGDYTSGNDSYGLGSAANGGWIDATGKHATLNGRSAYYDSTLISFGNTAVYGVGFDIAIGQSANNSPFDVNILTADGDSIDLFPLGGGNGIPSSAYDGFWGFVSNQPITGIAFADGDVPFTITNLEMTDPGTTVPEPGSYGLICAGLASLLVFVPRMRRQNREQQPVAR